MTGEKGVTKAQRWFCPGSGSHEGSRQLLQKALTGWEVGMVSLSPALAAFLAVGLWKLEWCPPSIRFQERPRTEFNRIQTFRLSPWGQMPQSFTSHTGCIFS